MFRTLRRKLVRFIVVSGAGAAANYFFDREKGPERRTQAKEKAASLVGRQTATDWQSSAANRFEPTAPATAPSAPSAPSAGSQTTAPPAADVLDGSSAEPAVDIPRTGPVATP